MFAPPTYDFPCNWPGGRLPTYIRFYVQLAGRTFVPNYARFSVQRVRIHGGSSTDSGFEPTATKPRPYSDTQMHLEVNDIIQQSAFLIYY
ncbi:hypothetical protein AVEN_85861-1 [Araneus ventricosus]|uniref:Uncharacterized protein n=1 Tax=Araneus ventricosus TaxID=182803 RepID=A0A4Y2KT20_ARAVE|nr:hypothetical protein AVEN_85861-1 [Araneus ventricosus]